MPAKFLISAIIAALLLTGTAIPVSPPPGQGAQLPQATQPVATLSKEDAIDIALEHAGLPRDQIRRLECEYDRDQGRPEWDIEFDCGGFEYSYEIHAETGVILEWDKELDH